VNNPILRFFLIGTVSYFSWFFLYELYLLPHTSLDGYLVDLLVKGSEGLLKLFGFALTEFNDGDFRNHIAIQGTPGVTVGAPCDGMILMALFIIFVLAYPGDNRRRIWFIPFGIVTIQILNILRISGLALIVYWNESYLSFNHDYTFTIIVYSYVFGLWYWWSKKSDGLVAYGADSKKS
jgi:exosortase family protein XrtF